MQLHLLKGFWEAGEQTLPSHMGAKAPLTPTLIQRQRDIRKACLCGQGPQSPVRAGVGERVQSPLSRRPVELCGTSPMKSHSIGKCCSLFDWEQGIIIYKEEH